MDFDLTAEQAAFRDSVVQFAEQRLPDDVGRRERTGDFAREGWERCAEFGIQGLLVPEEHGGSGADVVTTVVALEALGYGCTDNGLLFSLNAHMWACQDPIVRHGTDDQKRRYLPGLCDGTLIGAHAMSEPDSGSDAFSLRTRAVRRGNGFVLSGSKTFVSNGPVADLFVVFATEDPDKGFAGVTAFLVERDTPGLTVGPPVEKMGLRTSPMSEVFLDGCDVPDDAVLGRAGWGLTVFTRTMERERSLILATAVGTMERDLELSLAHAKEREQFGTPIGKFQAVSHRIVDAKVRLEAARVLLRRLAWMMDEGRDVALDSALVKLFISEAFVQSSLDAVRIHGGYGYMADVGLERDTRDAIASCLYSGTSDIQRNLIADQLGL